MKRPSLSRASALLVALLIPNACSQKDSGNSSSVAPSVGSTSLDPSTSDAKSESAMAHQTYTAGLEPSATSLSPSSALTHSTAELSVTTSERSAGETTVATTLPPTTAQTVVQPNTVQTVVTTDIDSTPGETSETGATEPSSASDSEQAPTLPALQPAAEPISFGTMLEAATVMASARELARTLVDPTSPQWRAKGDQHRTYRFGETNRDEPYRLYVPNGWDGQTKLPLVVFLHGAGSDENTYVDQNNQQLLRLAEEHGAILVAPLGASGAYGNFLRLSAPFGNPEGANELMAQVTPESRRANELSEMDVVNVIELMLAEYPVDQSSMYLTGHSMGSGGTWYIGGKYSNYWRAIAPMSGPFVQEDGYPWNNLQNVGILITEGTQTPSLDASRLLDSWLSEQQFDAVYQEVNADHGGMVPLVLPDVFAFFAARRG